MRVSIQKNLSITMRIICVSANFALDKKKELTNNILCQKEDNLPVPGAHE